MLLADTKMLGSILNDTLKEEIASCKEQAQGAITKAATTRLEWKMVNAMTNMSKGKTGDHLFGA